MYMEILVFLMQERPYKDSTWPQALCRGIRSRFMQENTCVCEKGMSTEEVSTEEEGKEIGVLATLHIIVAMLF